jgi:hypothetical protein
MTSEPSTSQHREAAAIDCGQEKDAILCPHCRRTATNGLKCKGICVADNDY